MLKKELLIDPCLDRARGLEHMLPPRPGGVLALLDQVRRAGTVDVVFGAHSGMKGFVSLRDMLLGQLIGNTIRVTFWRVPGSEIPQAADEQLDWLYDQWTQVDRLSGDSPRVVC